MLKYKDFRPTSYDSHISLDDREEWYVVLSMTRDSDTLTRSNYAMALAIVGGEGENVEVHSFGHWACGWFEIILASPELETQVLDIESRLENYPVLDDEHHSSLESDEFHDSWEFWGSSDFKRAIVAAFELSEVTEYFMDDLSHEKMMELFRSLDLNWQYESEGSGVTINIEGAVDKLSRSVLANFLWEERRKSRTEDWDRWRDE